jgi:hypothetical protein
MRRHRTTARGFLLTLALGLAAAASAAPAGVPQRIVFPVIGPAEYFAWDFGAPRPQGAHEGTDIMSARWAIAVAAEAGRVEFETGSRRAGCMLRLRGRSGTEYVYIHLNNDRGQQNDNRGGCVSGVAFPKGLKSGMTVAAGQPVGFVGDSGDADGIQPHLHFEVRPSGRGPVNPYKHLERAQRLLFHAPQGRTFVLRLTGTVIDQQPGRLRLKVDALRWWPNGMQVLKLGRTLVLDTSTAETERATQAAGGSSALAAGQRVTVFTLPAATTRAAQLGKAGSLVAARVVLLD